MDLIKTIEEEKIVVIVPGVKTEGETIADADMMRCEETELIGLMEHLESAAVYVLPGSHSKLIHVDGAGRIVDFTTMLTGEMIAALSQNTILKDAIYLAGTRLDESWDTLYMLSKPQRQCRNIVPKTA